MMKLAEQVSSSYECGRALTLRRISKMSLIRSDKCLCKVYNENHFSEFIQGVLSENKRLT